MKKLFWFGQTGNENAPKQSFKPNQAQIDEIKDRFLSKYEAEPPEPQFHEYDLERIKKNDIWVSQLLEAYKLDLDKTSQHLWDICAWRKSYGVNELTVADLNKEILHEGQIYVHNHDKNGKPLLIFNISKHNKEQKSEDLLRIIVYWVEQIHRKNYMEKITLFMDMTGTGLGNMDIDYVKGIINLFETRYPSTPNYILVHELPFLLNAAFTLVKGFLPAEALELLKVITKKNICEYVDLDNCLTSWGGNDDFVYQFA